MTNRAVGILVLLATACAAPGARPPSAATLLALPGPTRSGPECDSVVVRALTSPDSFPHISPNPSGIVLPPRPAGPGVRGKDMHIQLRVDEKGIVDPGSVVIQGITDTVYAKRMYDHLLQYKFYPGILEGCAVPGTWRVIIRVN